MLTTLRNRARLYSFASGVALIVLGLIPYTFFVQVVNSLRIVRFVPAALVIGIGIVFGISVITALIIYRVILRRFEQPLFQLAQAAQMLQQGKWPDPVPVESDHEMALVQSTFNELTETLRCSQQRLITLIDNDPLTGLCNHRMLRERLMQEASNCTLSQQPLSLAIFDIDNFEEYNKQHGHKSGDMALLKTADILRRNTPQLALASRFGADEFAIVLPGYDLDVAEDIARNICKQMKPEFNTDDLTMSAGCAVYSVDSMQCEELVVAAELALSRAKHLGKNQVCKFEHFATIDEVTAPYAIYKLISDGSFSTIQTLAAAVDAKDHYTRGHSRCVAKYSAELARRLKLPSHEVDKIQITGTLHDVGKIGIPDAILKKVEQLTPEERHIMETHTNLGEIIIRKAPQLEFTLPGVRSHHERWDGKGYPDRLSGKSIPLVARIIGLADAFDAMTSDRPYRKAMPVDIALSEIKRGSGLQFDPELCLLFAEMIYSDCKLFDQSSSLPPSA